MSLSKTLKPGEVFKMKDGSTIQNLHYSNIRLLINSKPLILPVTQKEQPNDKANNNNSNNPTSK